MLGFWTPGPVLVAGPCVVGDEAVNFAIAERLRDIESRLGLRVVFKASFDKANRASFGAPRGPGLDVGLEAMQRVHRESALPILTDVHEPRQAARAAEVVDALQIPAFLCRQTDLLTAAAAGADGFVMETHPVSPGCGEASRVMEVGGCAA